MFLPIADHLKIEVTPKDTYGFGGEKTEFESGIVVAVPNELHWIGMHSFFSESSFMDIENLDKILEFYEKLIGKKVCWSSMKERGSIVKEADGKSYAYLKFTDLFAVGEADDEVFNLYGAEGGSFKP